MTFRDKLSFRNWRISNKLLVVMLLVSLVPLLLAIWVLSTASVNALTQEMRDQMARLGNSVASHVSNVLGVNQGLLSLAANDPQVVAAITSGAAPGSEAGLNTVVANLLQANADIDTVGIYDANGTAMAHTDPATVGRNVSSRDFIKAALAGETFTSSYRRDLVNDKPGISLSAPVKNGSAVVGAVAIHLDQKLIDDVFAQTLAAETSNVESQARESINIYLVDPNGIVMSQSKGDDWLFHSLGALTPDLQARMDATKPLGGVCPNNAATCTAAEKTVRLPEPMPAVQPLANAVAESLQTAKPGSLRYCRPEDLSAPADSRTCNGAFHVAAFAPSALPTGSTGVAGMSPAVGAVVVDLPEASFLVAVQRQRTIGFAIAAFMGILAVLGSLLVARTLSRPISTLASTASEVEADQPFVPNHISDVTGQGDEVGHLARAFSRMVQALQARLADLRTISDIGRKVSASIELDETLAYVVTSLQSAIPFDAAEISLADLVHGRLVVHGFVVSEGAADDTPGNRLRPVTGAAAGSGGEAGSNQAPHTHPLPGHGAQPGGLIGQLLAQQSGEALRIDDLAATSAALQQEAALDRTWRQLAAPPRSYLGVPLLAKGKLVGAIELVRMQPKGFDDNNERVLESVASQAAVAIQNAQEVQARETELKNQIRELHIEIDEIKRSKQVDEIVDTDYFQKLSSQARRLRSSRSGGE